jgi:hypothetical protein
MKAEKKSLQLPHKKKTENIVAAAPGVTSINE